MKGLFAGAVCAALLGGCASVERLPSARSAPTPDGCTSIETVEIFNTNWLFLSLLPIASGDIDNPDGWTTCFFRDTATPANQIRMLEAEAKRVGARKAVNVATISTDEEVFLFLLMREKYHTTAELVK
mgnify:CR=1 FL=1